MKKFLWMASILGLISCQKREFNESQVQDTDMCQKEILLNPYLSHEKSCSTKAIEEKRNLSKWIPCNKINLLTHDFDVKSKNEDIIKWLNSKERFFTEDITALFSNRQQKFSWEENNPILQRPIPQEIKALIQNAKETIFFNIFLLGGTWGLDIVKDLLDATQRGVHVILLRDTENTVSVGFEMEPLWKALEEESLKNNNLQVLKANISKHPSGIPFGLEQLLKNFDDLGDFPVSLEGKSDHSKIVISDPFSQPKMIVGSKNTVDTAGAFFFDEALKVEGPAASIAMLKYLPDLKGSLDILMKDNKLKKSLKKWFEEYIIEIENIVNNKKDLKIKGLGNSNVLIAENNGDDSVRNIENTILNIIKSAQKSIDIYNFLAYNPSMAEALAEAHKKGIKVRVLLDSLEAKRELNSTFVFFMDEYGSPGGIDGQPVRWRVQLPLSQREVLGKMVLLKQQQHVKSIIVDGRYMFAGSANFDVATFAGAFREFSIIADDSTVAQNAQKNFDIIWNSEEHSVSFSDYKKKNPNLIDKMKYKSIKDIMITEQWRIKSLSSKNIIPQCLFKN